MIPKEIIQKVMDEAKGLLWAIIVRDGKIVSKIQGKNEVVHIAPSRVN